MICLYGKLFFFNRLKKYIKLFSASSPKTLGNSLWLTLSLKEIKLDELSSKYFTLFLNKIAIGFVSKIFIITVFGYFLLTSIFSKKSISFKSSSMSSFLIKKIPSQKFWDPAL